mmetsp:Transcript_42305/g.40526  ORF Transcript_42305/g.40526 Transcript_42305/m.40526 type:complete len:158 (-) Transcript_42305:360-833(-)
MQQVDFNCFENLTLDTNKFGSEGVAHLAKIIEHSKKLAIFSVINCQVDQEGGLYAAEALAKNTIMNYFLMAFNPILDKSAVALARALKINTTLQNIQLHNCMIGEEGALAFADMLLVNRSLIRVILKGNPLGNLGGQEILASLAENNVLRVINLQET